MSCPEGHPTLSTIWIATFEAYGTSPEKSLDHYPREFGPSFANSTRRKWRKFQTFWMRNLLLVVSRENRSSIPTSLDAPWRRLLSRSAWPVSDQERPSTTQKSEVDGQKCVSAIGAYCIYSEEGTFPSSRAGGTQKYFLHCLGHLDGSTVVQLF